MVVGGFRSFHVLVLTHVITVVTLKIRRYYIIYQSINQSNLYLCVKSKIAVI